MARYNYRYSMDRREKKLAGVCSTIGEVFNLDPTFIRVGFVAAAVLISWKLALIERQKAADMAEGLKAEIAVIDDSLKSYEADIAKLQAKLREARARQNALATRFETAHNQVRLREMYAGGRVEDAFSNFDLLEREADLAEGHAEALMLAAPPRTLEEEIAELKVADRVDAELEAMKARRIAA